MADARKSTAMVIDPLLLIEAARALRKAGRAGIAADLWAMAELHMQIVHPFGPARPATQARERAQ